VWKIWAGIDSTRDTDWAIFDDFSCVLKCLSRANFVLKRFIHCEHSNDRGFWWIDLICFCWHDLVLNAVPQMSQRNCRTLECIAMCSFKCVCNIKQKQFTVKFLWTEDNAYKRLHRVKHDTTAAGWQGKVWQVYIKHCILLDTIMCWTQQYAGNSNLPDQLVLYFAGHNNVLNTAICWKQ
jgi:hypothetical protein